MSKLSLQELVSKVAIPAPPSFDALRDILSPALLLEIDEVQNIISRYAPRESLDDVVFPQLLQDITNLQATQLRLATIVGEYVAQADRVKEHESLVRASIRNKLRAEKAKAEESGERVQGTVDEIKDIADELSLAHWSENNKVFTAAQALKYLYYTIGNTAERLDSLSHKLYDERFHRDPTITRGTSRPN